MNRYLVIGCGLSMILYRIIDFFTGSWDQMNQTWAVLEAVMALFLIISGILNNRNLYDLSLVFSVLFLFFSLIPIYANYVNGYPIKALMFARPLILLIASFESVKCILAFRTGSDSHQTV